MTMPNTFQEGTDWEGTSGPIVSVKVPEGDIWPQGARSVSGTKDTIDDGLHPAIAIGGMTAADGRPLNLTGVVMTSNDAASICEVNIAHGFAIKQYVNNILTYAAGAPDTFETAPVIGQPVYVDDSDDLSEGVTLSMSALNTAGLKNPLWGVLWYAQDEYVDRYVGGANTAAVWPKTLANSKVETEFTVLHVAGSRELA